MCRCKYAVNPHFWCNHCCCLSATDAGFH